MLTAPAPDADLARFFSLATDLLCVTLLDGRFEHVNPAWETRLGWPREKLLGAPLLDFVHPADREATQARMDALTRDPGSGTFRNRLTHRDGSHRTLLWSATADPSAGRIYAVVRDVAGEKAARDVLRRENTRLEASNETLTGTNAGLATDNEKLTHANRELERLNAELERFAYVASHDLSEPLRSIGGFVQLLDRRLDGRLDATSRDYLRRVLAATLRQQRLIDDLLRYARAGRRELVPQEVDCRTLVSEVLRDLAQVLRDSGAMVTVGAMPTLAGDPGLLAQVFQNLVTNALKFRGDDAPVVDVRATHVDGGWEFSVRDNGIGIAPEYRERVFEVFQRLHTRSRYDGTGVGLAIVRAAVERHGGRAWVHESDPPGADIRFHLPDRPGR